MIQGVWCSLVCLLLAAGCAGPMRDVTNAAELPQLRVKVLRGKASNLTSGLPPWREGDTLQPREAVTLEMQVDRTAYVAVVLYADGGQSENLVKDENQILPGQPLRVTVPRLAPVGVKETRLELVLATSASPLPPLLRQALHLPCKAMDRRGDPEPPPKPSREPSPPPDSKPSSGNPPEGQKGPPRGGGAEAQAVCEVRAGLSAPITVQTLLIMSE